MPFGFAAVAALELASAGSAGARLPREARERGGLYCATGASAFGSFALRPPPTAEPTTAGGLYSTQALGPPLRLRFAPLAATPAGSACCVLTSRFVFLDAASQRLAGC